MTSLPLTRATTERELAGISMLLADAEVLPESVSFDSEGRMVVVALEWEHDRPEDIRWRWGWLRMIRVPTFAGHLQIREATGADVSALRQEGGGIIRGLSLEGSLVRISVSPSADVLVPVTHLDVELVPHRVVSSRTVPILGR